jgi:hypothetical protein
LKKIIETDINVEIEIKLEIFKLKIFWYKCWADCDSYEINGKRIIKF